MTTIPYVLLDAEGSTAYALNSTFLIASHASAYSWGMQNLPRSHGGRALDKAYLNSRGIALRGTVGAGSAGGALPNPALTPFSYTGSGISGDIQFIASTKSIVIQNPAFTPLQIGQSLVIAGSSSNNKTVTIKTVTPTVITVNESLTDENSSSGTLTASMLPTIDVLYLAQIHDMSAFFLGHPRAILDYRNGFIQYVLVNGIKNDQIEGWPDLRAVEIDLLVEDPFGYGIPLLAGVVAGTVLTIQMAGNAPSMNYRLQLRSNTSSEQTVALYQVGGGAIELTLPASTTDPLVLHGWQRVAYQTVLTTLAWARVVPGGTIVNGGLPAPPPVFPILQPSTQNVFTVTDPAHNPLNLTDLDSPSSGDVQIKLTAHSAIWLADSFQAVANLPPGAYDASFFDLNLYA